MSEAGSSVGGVRAWAATIARVVLGGLFAFAAYAKMSNHQGFADSILAFKVPMLADHLVQLATFAVPWIELIAGALLILGLWTRGAGVLIGVLLACFTGLIVSALARDLTLSCSCFGKYEFPCPADRIGACHVARNLVLLGVAGVVVWWGPGRLAFDRWGMKA